jgi:hypothetical protein
MMTAAALTAVGSAKFTEPGLGSDTGSEDAGTGGAARPDDAAVDRVDGGIDLVDAELGDGA